MPSPESIYPGAGSWTDISSSLPQGDQGQVHSFAVNPAGIIVAGTFGQAANVPPQGPEGILHSADGGKTYNFVHIAGGQWFGWVRYDLVHGTFVALTDVGVAFSSPEGVTWTAGGTFAGSSNNNLRANLSGALLWMSPTLGPQRSTDGGATWAKPAWPPSGWTSAGFANYDPWLIFDGVDFLLLASNAGGAGIASSADGVTWSLSNFSNQTELPAFMGGWNGAGYIAASANWYRAGATLAACLAAAPLAAPVPGGRTILSCAVARDGRLLVIDSAGAVWGSANLGVSWEADVIPWAIAGYTVFVLEDVGGTAGIMLGMVNGSIPFIGRRAVNC